MDLVSAISRSIQTTILTGQLRPEVTIPESGATFADSTPGTRWQMKGMLDQVMRVLTAVVFWQKSMLPKRLGQKTARRQEPVLS